ncbi:MAG: hypothetical protein ACI4SD_01890 [Suilimivivens sp.]
MWTGNKKKKDNRGTTMVTVVVSFALLMIFVTGYFKVQKVSQNMMMDSKDFLVNNRELVKAYYLGETTDTVAAENARLTFRGDEGVFYIDASLYRAQKEGLTGTIFYYKSEEE